MKLFSLRLTYLIGFIIILLLLGGTTFLQLYEGVTPCPLCALQRITMAALGVTFFFAAAIHLKKFGYLFFGTLAFLLALLGALLSGRQVWLQHLPPNQSADCGVSLQYMLHVLPLHQVLMKVIAGGAECAQIGWQFLNLSLAEWSLIWFVLFLLVTILQLKRTLSD